ncbi:MAG: hypothetical protein J5996_00140 [Prevotella sp.]|nr:hypothetical protein [Prevotella sp.]
MNNINMINKSFKTWTILLSLLLATSMEMKAQDVINYFYMKGEVCPPVILSTSDGTKVVNNGDRIDGNISIYSATDCSGNKILDISSDKTSTGTGQATVREYVFSTLYPTMDNSAGSYSDDYYAEPYSNSSTGGAIGNTVVGGVNKFAEGMRRMTYDSSPVAGYPYLALALGISRMYGEFARLHCCLGGDAGFQLYGGIGKDWIFDGDNKDKMSWHAGLGYYMALGYDANQQFDFGITYSETAVIAGGAITCDFGYRYFVGRTKRFGFFGGMGFGVGNVKDSFKERYENEKFPGKFVWDVQVGVCVKIFAGKG